MNEIDFQDQLHKVFDKHFDVHREVTSVCGTARIDMVLTYHGRYSFGIECKRPDPKRGIEIGKYIQQAIRYTETEFHVLGKDRRIPVLICPPLSYMYFVLNAENTIIDGIEWHKDRHPRYHTHHSMNGFLGAFGIGEVKKTDPNGSYAFVFKNQKIFFANQYQVGVDEQKYIQNYGYAL